MKSASMSQLLEMGYILFQKQDQLKKMPESEQNLFNEEIKMILNMILMDMGIIQGKIYSNYVVNTDHYEYFIEMYAKYCRGEISREEMIDLTYALRIEEHGYVVKGARLYYHTDRTGLVNALFDLNLIMQEKRKKVGHLLECACDFLRIEKNIVNIALDEIGKRSVVFPG